MDARFISIICRFQRFERVRTVAHTRLSEMDTKGYLKHSVYRFESLKQAQSARATAALFVYQIFQSTPRTFRRVKVVDRLVKFLSEKVFRSVGLVDVDGIIYVPLDGGSFILVQKEYESWMQRYLKLEKGSVFIDVGANVGKYSLALSKIIGDSGKIVAVEPVPRTFDALAQAVKINGLSNIIPLNIACWSENTKLDIFLSEYSGSCSIKRNFGLGHVIVEAKTLDSLVNELGLNRVDFVKIDVEGSELEVLEGMKNTLKTYRPRIVIELREQYKDPLLSLMEHFDYSCELIEETKGAKISYYYLHPKPVDAPLKKALWRHPEEIREGNVVDASTFHSCLLRN